MSLFATKIEGLPPDRGVAGARLPGWSAEVDRQADRVVLVLVLLGMALRLIRYLTFQPIWGDEAFLATNWIDRSYAELLQPLDYHQIAPLFFLWLQKSIVEMLGFATWSMRLFPLMCGLASVVLFAWLARQVLGGWPRILAVAIFAVSFYPIRHATEIKPYASDLAFALLLLNLGIAYWRTPSRLVWLGALSLAAPLSIGISHPAVFVAGGVSLALLPRVAAMRRGKVWAAYVGYNVAICAAFGIFYLLATRGQAADAGAGTHHYWAAAFPPWDRPWAIPLWFLQANTSHMFAYPIGEARGGSTATTLLCVVGVVLLIRGRRGGLAWMLLAPFALGLFAACLGRYPYGGSARTMQYVAPSICLLAGLGGAWIFFKSVEGRRARVRMGLAIGLLVLIGVGGTGRDVLRPYKFPEDLAAREFAKRFWSEEGRGAEVVCLKRDLGVVLRPTHWETGSTAVYLCHQAMYARGSKDEPGPDWDQVARGRPLRCVLYNEILTEPAVADWLNGMTRRFELRDQRTLVAVPPRTVGGLMYEDRYDVYEFVPRSAAAVAELASAARSRTANR